MTAFNLVLLLAATSSAIAGHIQGRNHHEIAVRSEGTLAKRFFSPRVTWYDTNTGPDACTGKNHLDSDQIVAINTAQWQGGKVCGKRIRITANGKTATGVIQDLCASCPEHGQVDFTKSLFQVFAPLSKGIFEAQWEFIDGSGGGDPKPDPPKPKPNPPKPKPSPPKPAPPPPPPKEEKPKEEPKKEPKKEEKPKPKPSSSAPPKSTPPPSSSAKPTPVPSPSPPVVPVAPAVPPAAVVPPASEDGVANAGTNPNEDSTAGISGGIASDGLNGNGAAAVSLSGLIAGAAAFLVLAQAL